MSASEFKESSQDSYSENVSDIDDANVKRNYLPKIPETFNGHTSSNLHISTSSNGKILNKTPAKLPPLRKGKLKKSKRVSQSQKRRCRSFNGPPEQHPLTVSFGIYPNNLDHVSVLQMVLRRLSRLQSEDRKVEFIKCELRNVICGTYGIQIYPNNLDHVSVLQMVLRRLSRLQSEDRKVEFIKCELRNVICGTYGIQDRWVIKVNSELAMKELLQGLADESGPYIVKKYTDVLQDEYKMYLKLQKLAGTMNKLKIEHNKVANVLLDGSLSEK